MFSGGRDVPQPVSTCAKVQTLDLCVSFKGVFQRNVPLFGPSRRVLMVKQLPELFRQADVFDRNGLFK